MLHNFSKLRAESLSLCGFSVGFLNMILENTKCEPWFELLF